MKQKKTLKKMKSKPKIKFFAIIFSLFILLFLPQTAYAVGIDINLEGSGVDTIEILEILTILALVPSVLIMTTCFTRIIIVLSFLRNALGLQQTPPNQVLIGIALFLTLFIMSPIV